MAEDPIPVGREPPETDCPDVEGPGPLTFLTPGMSTWACPSSPGEPVGTLAKLKTTDCLRAVGPSNVVYLRYGASSYGGTWQSISDLTYPGAASPGALEVWFSDGALHLSLDGDELLYSGGNCWVGGPLTGHVADSGGACEGEIFSVCLSCHCCPIDGFTVAGWYCADIGDGCEPLYISDADACDDAITYCSGPYDTHPLAAAECGPDDPILWPCAGRPVVTAIACVVKTGDCTCLPDTATIGSTGPTNATEWTTITCPGNFSITLDCTGGFLAVTHAGGGGVTTTIIYVDATTVLIQVTGYGVNCGGGGGSAVWQLTGTF